MDRKTFVKLLASVPLLGMGIKLSDLQQWGAELSNTPRMPVLFLGHGSPMNAIEDNQFVRGIRQVSSELTTPAAVLCISAHWETNGTKVTAMESPRTIHDFYGFPKELFAVQYPAPGSPEIAKQTKELITSTDVILDDQWGLDHGAWSVIKHLYPQANVPVIQLSLDRNKDARYHYELAKELSKLRNKGVLIVGSGNMVHNLGAVAWNKLNEDYAYDWAIEASDAIKDHIHHRRHDALINYRSYGRAFQLAIPTPEHYLPLLYALALQEENEEVKLFNDKPLGGSLSMTSLKIG